MAQGNTISTDAPMPDRGRIRSPPDRLTRHEAKLDQDRRYIGCLENPETGGPQRLLVKANRVFQVAHQRTREMGRERARLALRQIDQCLPQR